LNDSDLRKFDYYDLDVIIDDCPTVSCATTNILAISRDGDDRGRVHWLRGYGCCDFGWERLCLSGLCCAGCGSGRRRRLLSSQISGSLASGRFRSDVSNDCSVSSSLGDCVRDDNRACLSISVALAFVSCWLTGRWNTTSSLCDSMGDS
jgi:hypothetical protein